MLPKTSKLKFWLKNEDEEIFSSLPPPSPPSYYFFTARGSRDKVEKVQFKSFSIFARVTLKLVSLVLLFLYLFSFNTFGTFTITIIKLKFISKAGLLHLWLEIVEAVKAGSETLNMIVPILAIFIFGSIIGYAVYIAYNNYVVNTQNGLIVVNSWCVFNFSLPNNINKYSWKS